MSTILVFLYAYKNKKLFKAIDLLYKQSSKTNNIKFIVFDQDNENKKDYYLKYNNVEYNHIFWDTVDGVSLYRNKAIDQSFDYFLEIGNINSIEENWDIKLIEYAKTNSFISIESNLINLDFIFCNKKNTEILKSLFPLKYYGQDLLLYYFIYKNNLTLFKINEDFCNFENNNLLNSDYIPYSLTHKYNEKLSDVFNDTDFIKHCSLSNIKINKIKNIKNDIEYSSTIYNLDGNSQKFFNVLKTIRKVG